MKGLEISEVMFSEVPIENIVFRIDAEYFKKRYLIEDHLRRKYSTIYLGEDFFITDGQHGYHEVDEKSEIRHLTAKNFKNWFADDIGADRLAKWVDDNNKRSSLQLNDVVLSTRGSVGYCALVKEQVLPANIDQDVARIAIENHERLRPQFLVTFINSKFGQDWAIRNQTGMVQQGLALWRVREMPIPFLSKEFQDQITGIVENGYNCISLSKERYTQAENLLLETLGLKNFHPSQESVNIKSFSESFEQSGRLDAEYYQVKYEQIVEKIQSTNFDRLSNLVNIKKSIEPGSANYNTDGLPFVRVSDFDQFGLSTPDKYLTDEFCSENSKLIKKLKPKKETILFSKDGSVGTAYMLRKDADFITSGAILHLTVKDKTKIIPEYLTLALNSKLVQMQAERDAGGSIILHWRVSEIQNVVVPIIEFNKQREIADLLEESFRLKNQSEHFLEVAKTAVEMAIEKDEEAAVAFINNNTN